MRDIISPGLASARAGRLVDGAEVLARLHAKLDALERQDHGSAATSSQRTPALFGNGYLPQSWAARRAWRVARGMSIRS